MIASRPRPRTTTAVAALLFPLALSACSSGASGGGSPAPVPSPSGTSPAQATTSSSPRAALTAQGFLPKEVGQAAGIDCASDLESCKVKFTVDEIEVSPECDEFGTPASDGRKTFLLHVSLTTGEMSENGKSVAPLLFNPYSLKGIGDDGFVHDALPGSCAGYDGRISNDIFNNSKYTGKVEVELPASTTSIASAHDFGENRGWVWKIPA
ncbi:hypothetical protein [Actinosynnema mirum]|uniref:DUF4352 domain-containing protein n=1 Tax=Actinosynnema mirum (strain ATCC 29888 / DSM 43827 / JCM 3225 / NBRC 14064 / NCIMB 13271 / NRRL B-12336 / IMRU 3971 / 101) TaxID=446462 RepID=C6WMJ3_ACTMD|nr:hypothetical protein [Actinosynnema mirum]ACU36522.1 hypothetical protein Amir_2585 [Actinosynnema mirum DSM 43827]